MNNRIHISPFFGAGCSVSSGIPAAGALVRDRWLPELRNIHGKQFENIEEFVKTKYPDWHYDAENPAALYGEIIKALFPFPADRQSAIEALCDKRFPGFGYATLAALITREGGCFNAVLTTNFDNMVADSLYLYSNAHPLVIQHESLANFIKPSRTRPLVVKLHGDHRLSPSNTVEEVHALKTGIENHVRTLLCDRHLIFLGYGGYDEGICKMLEGLPSESCGMGVYWVNASEPTGPIRHWLNAREAIWVEQGDFDELMLLFRDEFNLPHPQKKRFDDLFTQYMETYQQLSTKIKTREGENEETNALKSAVQKADESFTDWWAVKVAASNVKNSDPDEADRIYREGITRFPNSAPLMDSYAIFLCSVRKAYDLAEEYFNKALSVDPTNAITIGNYAYFLCDVRKSYDQAEEYFRKSEQANPTFANNIANYTGLLLARGRQIDGMQRLEKLLAAKDDTLPVNTQVELWFYAYAHRLVEEERAEALVRLMALLREGGRAPGCHLEEHIARAEEDGHPNVSLLKALDAVITRNAPLSTLDEFGLGTE